MTNRLVLTPRAAADLEDIGDFVAVESPAAAARQIARLEAASRMLRDHPHVGVARSEIAEGLRVFPVGNFLILFRARDDGVEIVRYAHGARRLQGLV